MNNTTHFNLKKPEYTDFADIQDINDNMDTIDGQLAAPTGDVRDATVSFSDSDLDSNINSFSDFLNKIVSGMKLAKFIRDFKAGMAYVLHKGSLINNGTTSVTGTYALDAAYGKTLKDYYDSLNSSLSELIIVRTGRWSERTIAAGLSTLVLTSPSGMFDIPSGYRIASINVSCWHPGAVMIGNTSQNAITKVNGVNQITLSFYSPNGYTSETLDMVLVLVHT